MMRWLPERPAFPGLRPPELKWLAMRTPSLETSPENAQAWAFLQLLSEKHSVKIDQAWQLQTHQTEPYGFFRLTGEMSNSEPLDWFLKLVAPQKAKRMLEGQALVDAMMTLPQPDVMASNATFSVPPMIHGFPNRLSEEVTALAFPFWEGRFTDYQAADLRLLGQALGQLHRRLKGLPQVAKIQAGAKERHAMLTSRWQALLQSPTEMAQLPAEAQACLKAHSPDWLGHLMDDGQPVHGDLNVGNVLFRPDGRVAFLDFEDSLTAWFDPLKDLAFVIERFVLCVHEPAQLAAMSHALLDAYLAENPVRIHSEKRFVDLLQGLAVRAFLILAELQLSTQQKIPQSEWQKFAFLYNLTLRHDRELKAMAAPYVV
ncbi:MAG: phosphotransferase enzyme family protein [Hydrogenovibrio sp.]